LWHVLAARSIAVRAGLGKSLRPRQPSPRIRISTSMLSLRVPSGIVGSSLKRTWSSGMS